ncbi:MAG: hypothetical protein WCA77_06305 [Thermoplasmata archaeon]
MSVELRELPRFMVLEPGAGIRVELKLTVPACEIDAQLDAPRPGKSFILMIGHRDGPFVQRARIAGGARLLFDPEAPGEYVVLLVNPTKDVITVRLEGHGVGRSKGRTHSNRSAQRRRRAPPKSRTRSKHHVHPATPHRTLSPRGNRPPTH